MSFKFVSLVFGASSILTSVVYMYSPELIHTQFSIESGESANVLSRRSAIPFFTLGLILLIFRNLPNGVTRRNFSMAMAIFMLAFSALGLIELSRGVVGYGILAAVVVEFAGSAPFLYYALSRREDK